MCTSFTGDEKKIRGSLQLLIFSHAVKGKKYHNKCVSVINRNGLFGLHEILDHFILLFITPKPKTSCKRPLTVPTLDCTRTT